MLATLEPKSLWHREPKPEDSLAVGVYSAALECLKLFGQGWTRQSQRCHLDEYEPSVVRFHLRNWQQLVAAANGMSAAGAEPIGSAGEVDARRTLISIKSDMEQGTDHGLYTVLNWRMAERIYKRQGREDVFEQRRAKFRATWREELPREPWQPLAEAICIERISRCLGWYPHDLCKEMA